MLERVDIVDDNGSAIGMATRNSVHAKGLLHPTVKVLLFNSTGNIFLQQRSGRKDILPLYWDVSVAEHVLFGETHVKAAERGLREELSVKAKVRLLRNNHVQISEHTIKNRVLREYELVKLYGVVYDGRIEMDPQEVKQGIFVGIAELKEMIYQTKTLFTPWGLDELVFLLKNDKKIAKEIGLKNISTGGK